MASQTEENYLKALFSLSNEKETVNISELSSTLNVSLPTVNSMVKNLKNQNLVNYQKYKPLTLTEKGKKLAASIVRKHRLTEMYLVNKMGFGWEEVHEIAEQIEHINSTALFERMDEILKFPTMDPHGSPIPDKNGKINIQNYLRLSSCESGSIVRFASLSSDSSDFLKFLNNYDLHLRVEIEILSIESFDRSMKVKYLNHPSETFSKSVCDRILVELLNL
jgi:DtxR family Mn-dependent transcriptional regulator